MQSAAEVIRASGIGASEIAAIVGISPFADRWQIWARKKGLIETQQTDEMFWGKQLEPVIARVFSERMGLPVEWCDRQIFSTKRAWQYASPDAFVIIAPCGPKHLLECKTAGLHQSGEWDRDAGNEDGVPDYYVAQVEWQMSTLEIETAYIAVLIAGNDFRVYRINHDPVLEEILVDEGDRFWRHHILADREPPIGASRRAHDYLQRRYPREREKLRPATLEEIALLNEYAQVRAQFEACKSRRDELENQLKNAIGEAEGLTYSRGKFTWKRTKDHVETDWEELAKSQLVGLSEDQKAAFIEEYTHTVPGSRRIYFRKEEKIYGF